MKTVDNVQENKAHSVLKRIWAAWKRVGQFIGDLIARVVLSLFYFTVFVPFGLGMRIFGDPLNIKTRSRRSWWQDPVPQEPTLDSARRQF